MQRGDCRFSGRTSCRQIWGVVPLMEMRRSMAATGVGASIRPFFQHPVFPRHTLVIRSTANMNGGVSQQK